MILVFKEINDMLCSGISGPDRISEEKETVNVTLRWQHICAHFSKKLVHLRDFL